MSIIPATGEVEFRRIIVQGQPEQNISEIPFQKTSQSWWCALVIPASQEA
jgi:hypothetical protein